MLMVCWSSELRVSITPGVRFLMVKVGGGGRLRVAPSEYSSNFLSIIWGKKFRLVGLDACGYIP